jgi:hypothetical protein
LRNGTKTPDSVPGTTSDNGRFVKCSGYRQPVIPSGQVMRVEQQRAHLRLRVLALLALAVVFTSTKASSGSPRRLNLTTAITFAKGDPLHSLEYSFAIDKSRVESITDLKAFLGNLPPGSEITWAPGCLGLGGEPGLLQISAPHISDFRSFLKQKGIKFIFVPAG